MTRVIFAVAALAALSACNLHDDSDPPGGRSGMTPLVDSKTGCEYLGYRGGITPRLGRDGKQVCG